MRKTLILLVLLQCAGLATAWAQVIEKKIDIANIRCDAGGSLSIFIQQTGNDRKLVLWFADKEQVILYLDKKRWEKIVAQYRKASTKCFELNEGESARYPRIDTEIGRHLRVSAIGKEKFNQPPIVELYASDGNRKSVMLWLQKPERVKFNEAIALVNKKF